MLGEEGLREVGEGEGNEGDGGGGQGQGQGQGRGRGKGWGVIRRLGTPEEIRKHYQRVLYEKRLSQIEAMVKTKGDISVNIDARACFLPISFFKDPSVVQHDWLSRARRTRVGGMGVKHTFETPFSPQTSFLFQAQLMTRNNAGGGNIITTMRHAFGPRLWVEAGTSLIHPRVGTGKVTFAYDENTFGTLNVVQQTMKAPPTLALTVGKKVFAKTTGFMTLRSGFWSLGPWGAGLAESLGRTDKPAISFGLTNQGHTGQGFTIETTGGIVDRHVSLDYTLKVLDGYKVKVGAAVGTMGGINGFLNTERQVTDNLRVGLGLTAQFPAGGITMRLRIWRLGQKIVIPIMLAPDVNPKVLLFSTVIPATSILAFQYLFVEPRRRHKLENKMTELQQEHAEYLAQKKAEALDSIALMEDHAARKVEQERESENGLIVISAHYGLATAFEGIGVRDLPGEEAKVIDVTVPIQALVTAGKLHISGGRGKFNLLGFYDPCMGERKSLRVQYLFKGVLHEATVDDHAALRAPMRSHAVEDSRNGNWEA